ncbi:DUF2798 domain-containing protein [Pseudomaricurvus alkylphenolicus]|nr:DUF2798 domain-containing protein [Pseudomaricurvus alkylphenolicus]
MSQPLLKKKQKRVLSAFYMSIVMPCIMSLVISIYNVGLTEDIVGIWANAWIIASCVAFPATYLVTPFVHKLVMATLKLHQRLKPESDVRT